MKIDIFDFKQFINDFLSSIRLVLVIEGFMLIHPLSKHLCVEKEYVTMCANVIKPICRCRYYTT